ncbi:uncharacterized protein LOC116112952 [Pistacia vera]|uniref:uncharacterized protein LOC116112952 n=1 Tax=Pistacia vera TaxID=55513 RepID=UPI001263B4C6|nr:uncharacterized protein LOC116112952 [Pistacia vera]
MSASSSPRSNSSQATLDASLLNRIQNGPPLTQPVPPPNAGNTTVLAPLSTTNRPGISSMVQARSSCASRHSSHCQQCSWSYYKQLLNLCRCLGQASSKLCKSIQHKDADSPHHVDENNQGGYQRIRIYI